MDRLENGICVSVLRKSGSQITMSIYGVQKDSDIIAIRENVYKIAQDLTGVKTPNVSISFGVTEKDEVSLSNLTMEDLL